MKSLILALGLSLGFVIHASAQTPAPLPYCRDIMESVKLRCVPTEFFEEVGVDQVNECFADILTSYLESTQGDEIREKCEIDYLKPANFFRDASEPYRFRDKKK